jgi:hypothetical protein
MVEHDSVTRYEPLLHAADYIQRTLGGNKERLGFSGFNLFIQNLKDQFQKLSTSSFTKSNSI